MLELSEESLNAASDEELAVLAKDSVDAEALLLKRYLKLVRYYAGHYAASETDADDLAQEGLITLLHVISKFRPEEGTKFSAYAQVCIVNRMRTLVKKVGNYEAPVADITQLMEEQAVIADPETPESILVEKENYARCRMQVMALLSAKEWEILQCIMSGASYAQTAEMLGITAKSVDNAMQRVRRKMRAVKSTEYFE
ncbi:MAG: sigma-70 family RNA polymerase sigma factor [Oscillospiraceae bacterium]|nr:sigma-70 family RNA polymerase sigma factor [Oscillospiraceae bacterium]